MGEAAAAAAALAAPWRRRGARVAGAEEEEPSRGETVETKITAASRGRVTPRSVGQEQRWRECGKPQRTDGKGEVRSCQVFMVVSVAVAFLSVFVPDALAP